MCGLAGLITLNERAQIDRGLLDGMAATLAHRGPDGRGVWLEAQRRIGLAHRRLAIIDLDAKAAQPMADAGGCIRVTYNGEIYNHAALRRRLEEVGARFLTDHSDTEVLLQGYQAWGIDGLLARLEGMFAFALYDGNLDALFLVRDRMGIKPLYFTEHNGLFAFASEIKALLALPDLPRRVDAAAAYHYLSFMVAPAPASLFAGIAKLPAGHLLEIGRDRRPKARRWWSAADHIAVAAEKSPKPGTNSEAIGEVRRLLQASVEKHMVADIPVGVFLSGGVDSSTALALMAQVSSRPVRSFTVGFRDEESLNELAEARAAADLYGAEHHEVMIGEADAEACLASLIQHQDEALADWVCIPLYFVAKLAASTGTKAILVGEGADELFFGYDNYLKFLRLHERIARLGRFAPAIAGPILRLARDLLPRERLGLIGLFDHLYRGLAQREVFWTGAIAFWEGQKRRITAPAGAGDAQGWSAYGLREIGSYERDSFAIVAALKRALASRVPHSAQVDRMRYAEFSLRLPELLLMRTDKMTMAHSLEARVPFLDHTLVEYALGLDRTALLPAGQTKGLLKAAVADLLPAEVLARPKRGFGAPMARWLRGAFGARRLEQLEASRALAAIGLDRAAVLGLFRAHRSGRRDLSLQLWPIINFALWYDHWIEGHSL
ncbi:MAG TPA: asparagine synthase (glutamine-hydrolyzing) [Hyphomicrobiaceae bacterium]|nr:asparagine synthase (glutamine-hydrolyzing) [Hyphomicrobiaceae bacterium]